LESLGINLGVLIIQVIAFIIVFLSLQAWVYKPLLNMLKTRREKIEQGMEDARVASEARASAERDAAKIIADAQTRSAHIVNEANERAEKAALQVKADAEQDIARERESALAEIAMEREHILGDLRGEVASLAIAAAQKLVGEALDEKRQRALLDEFFSGIKSGRVVLLDAADFKGETAQVVSALPLTATEQDLVKKSVLSKVGAQAVSFRVDPSIMGGLVITVGDRVLDGSVAGKLEALRQNLR